MNLTYNKCSAEREITRRRSRTHQPTLHLAPTHPRPHLLLSPSDAIISRIGQFPPQELRNVLYIASARANRGWRNGRAKIERVESLARNWRAKSEYFEYSDGTRLGLSRGRRKFQAKNGRWPWLVGPCVCSGARGTRSGRFI
jgi:hypothetical protein